MSARNVAVVGFAHAPHVAETYGTPNGVEMLVPIFREVFDQTGLTKSDIGFWCSGSSDYLAGRAFSFVSAVDAIGALGISTLGNLVIHGPVSEVGGFVLQLAKAHGRREAEVVAAFGADLEIGRQILVVDDLRAGGALDPEALRDLAALLGLGLDWLPAFLEPRHVGERGYYNLTQLGPA